MDDRHVLLSRLDSHSSRRLSASFPSGMPSQVCAPPGGVHGLAISLVFAQRPAPQIKKGSPLGRHVPLHGRRLEDDLKQRHVAVRARTLQLTAGRRQFLPFPPLFPLTPKEAYVNFSGYRRSRGWIPLVLFLFASMPARRAAMIGVIGAWLFLPNIINYYMGSNNLAFNKITATSMGVLIAALLFDAPRLLSFRPRWIDPADAYLVRVPYHYLHQHRQRALRRLARSPRCKR